MNILTAQELLAEPTVVPCLIDGYVPKRALMATIAATGLGKTFLMLDMAMCGAAGLPWQGRATDIAGVLYVLAEGFSGLPARVLAWCVEHDIAPAALDGRIGFCKVPFDVTDEALCETIVAELSAMDIECDFIVIDTLSANAPIGFKESDTDQMKLLIDGARWLRDRLNCTVALVHHTGWDKTRERGSTELRGSVDVMLQLDGEVSSMFRSLRVVKARDFAGAEPMRLKLTPKHGAIVVESADPSARDEENAGITPAQRAVLIRLAEEGQGAPVRANDWQRVSGYAKGHFYRLRAELEKDKYVLHGKAGYVLTQTGQDVVSTALVALTTNDVVSRSHIGLIETNESSSVGLISPRSLDRENETERPVTVRAVKQAASKRHEMAGPGLEAPDDAYWAAVELQGAA